MKKMTMPKKGFLIVLFVILSIIIASISFTTYTASVRKSQKMEGEEISGSDVTVCEQKVKRKDENGNNQSVAFVERYDTEIHVEKDVINISVGDDSDELVRDVKLYVEKVQLVEYVADTNPDDNKHNSYNVFSSRSFSPTDYVFYYKHPTSVPKSLVAELQGVANTKLFDGHEPDSLLLTFRSVNPKDDPLCVGSITFDIAVDLSAFAEPETEVLDVPEPEDFQAEDPTSSINCANPQTEFEKSYCSMDPPMSSDKVHKTNLGDLSERYGIKKNSEMNDNDSIKLQCNAGDLVDYNSSVLDNGDESKYFVNETTFFASSYREESIPNRAYVYHYAPKGTSDNSGFEGKSVSINVGVTCTEKVRVQYGPPVAATAGLCFEYNVKVTSTVTCKPDILNKPEKPVVCTPVPECYHPSGDWTGPAAGPDDSYDQCIKNCDGGKYTLSCSEKCYKSVYSSDSSKTSSFSSQLKGTKVADFTTGDDDAGTIAECLEIEKNGSNYHFSNYHEDIQYYGCYYWDNGNIEWYGGNVGTIDLNTAGKKQKGTRLTPGRWYMLHRKKSDLSKFESNNDGFLRKKFANNLCTAICKWSGCTTDQYLNPAVAKHEYDLNVAQYNAAKEDVKKYTTCSERTAEFKMEITKNDQSVYDVSTFSSADSLTSKESGYSVSDAEKFTNKNFLRDYAGCYQSSSLENGEKEWYQAIWGFPGTWIDVNKTQAITYKPHSGYLHLPHKFCLPYKLDPVNEEFWINYYAKKYQNDAAISFHDDKNVCNCNPQYNADLNNANVHDWNISATTRDFGRFKWNIDISCFYSYAKSVCDDPKCEKNPDDMVRTVDLNDLFPVSGTEGGTHDDSVSGRTPGFNWDKFAKNDKDPNFESDPVAYMKWVQQTGDKIWEDDTEIDYDIYLTRGDIKKIREKSAEKGFNISDYEFVSNQEVTSSNVASVTNYQSNLIRNELENRGTNKVPEGDLLKCNNIYQSKECLIFKSSEGVDH